MPRLALRRFSIVSLRNSQMNNIEVQDNGVFCVRIMRSGKKHIKRFRHLKDAQAWRDEMIDKLGPPTRKKKTVFRVTKVHYTGVQCCAKRNKETSDPSEVTCKLCRSQFLRIGIKDNKHDR